MFELPALLRLTGALAAHAAERHAAAARNIAHADTPGYRAERLAPFARVLEEGGGARPPARPASAAGVRIPDRPWTPTAAATRGEEAAPNGNAVSVEAELVEAAAARHDHALALAVWKSATGILRSTLAR